MRFDKKKLAKKIREIQFDTLDKISTRRCLVEASPRRDEIISAIRQIKRVALQLAGSGGSFCQGKMVGCIR